MSCRIKTSFSLLSFRESWSFILPQPDEILFDIDPPMYMSSS